MKRKILSDEQSIQLVLINPIYQTKTFKIKDKAGNIGYIEKEVFIKELPVKKWMRKSNITSVEQYITTSNKIAKSRSIIFDQSCGRFYSTLHTPEDIWKNIVGENTLTQKSKIGFKP